MLQGRLRHSPGLRRHSPGLRLGITSDDWDLTVALLGSDASIAPLSACGVTVYRGSARTLPAFTGAPPGH
ncbi:hypothetical protein DPMN_020670 [Dreissena polymorpha]|uniref:Uncharacterized protein n=1 Tax=Dreissena polymorpha TaxID=45954 RepID=A0A9D4NH74_DREPO|nr:hypothetical protein DPMN_020670 [Dreissena polymorpha]